MARARLRELGITIGRMATGPFNAITDVPGILVGHETLLADDPYTVRTGVTMIVPRAGNIWTDHACAGFFSLNGCGEMTGLPWVEESGTLHTPIGITNTNAVGIVRDAIAAYPTDYPEAVSLPPAISDSWTGSLPVVAETWDGWLNDINRFSVTKEHAYAALRAAQGGRVAEGNVGGGTGMICHEFKGGIGTSSRVITTSYGLYTLGVLVQANYGKRYLLRVDGVPVGQMLENEQGPERTPSEGGSIIIIIATDAPLLPGQCTRLAKRAALGLARVGGVGFNGSGDIFLAFATGNHLPIDATGPLDLKMLPHDHLNPFFEATAEAVEESILNALTSAETMIGWQRRTVPALPLDELQNIVQKYRPHI